MRVTPLAFEDEFTPVVEAAKALLMAVNADQLPPMPADFVTAVRVPHGGGRILVRISASPAFFAWLSEIAALRGR